MMSGNNPVESLECFFSSLRWVKVAFLPLESTIQKAVKDLEYFWPVSPNTNNRLVEVLALSSIADGINKKVQIFSVKQRNVQIAVSQEEKTDSRLRVPLKPFCGVYPAKSGSRCQDLLVSDGEREKDARVEASPCVNCAHFATTWFPMLKRMMQSLPNPFRTSKKRIHKFNNGSITSPWSVVQANNPASMPEQELQNSRCVKGMRVKDEKHLGENEYWFKSMECLVGFICDQINQTFQKFDHGLSDNRLNNCESSETSTSQSHLLNTTANKGRKVDFSVFFGNLRFARVGDVSQSLVGVDSPANEEGQSCNTEGSREESGGISPQKLATGLLTIALPNVELLRSTLSTVSLAELIQLIPHLGQPSNDYPDKKKLFSVQDFFRYTETEGMKFFEELDRDGDGHVTLEDLEVAMKKRKLPQRYARDFMHRTKRDVFSKSFGWKQFLSLMEQKEPTILRAYTSLCLSKSGTLHKSEILVSLKNAGLPANEDNAVAMMRFLNADTGGSISYGHFRNFMLLLPSDRLQDDPRSVWFEAATVVAVPPPVEIPAGSVLRSALAGGLASALSTSLLHPIDTIKTRVQASTLPFTEIISKLPEIGVQGLYRGAVPAILGQFSSHGLRTGIFEASKLLLIHFAPSVPEIQVQSLASFCSTFLGTAVRIPCEVLKQRLQAGIFDNVGEAIVCTWHQDGLSGFFRGTAATLCREVPFYVAGMGLYAESKKAAQGLLRRELEPWETIAVGAVSGGLAAVVTTPFDVMKTRMMTAPPGQSVSMATVAFLILRHEGPLGLFKGAIPRFFWIAPLGAMNFAGYELARKAMDQNNDTVSEQKLATSP